MIDCNSKGTKSIASLFEDLNAETKKIVRNSLSKQSNDNNFVIIFLRYQKEKLLPLLPNNIFLMGSTLHILHIKLELEKRFRKILPEHSYHWSLFLFIKGRTLHPHEQIGSIYDRYAKGEQRILIMTYSSQDVF